MPQHQVIKRMPASGTMDALAVAKGQPAVVVTQKVRALAEEVERLLRCHGALAALEAHDGWGP
eukprot:10419357-Alexandrium_andersonii.AAC.1